MRTIQEVKNDVFDGKMGVAEALEEIEQIKEMRGYWVPACNRNEVPFTKNGIHYLYCWNPVTRKHAYIDLDRDIALTDEEAAQIMG